MPGQHGVDAVHGGEGNGGVFHAFGMLGGADAGMRKGDDDVGAVLKHHRDPCVRSLHDVAGLDLAFEMAAIPLHDLRRHEADEADADRMFGAVAVLQRAVENDIGLDEAHVLRRVDAHFLDHVRGHDGEIRPGERLHQKVEAVVEFVVAKRRCLDPHGVERGDDRVHVAVLHAPLIGDVVAHRVALQEVAVVEKEGVRRLGADLLDMGGGAGKADGVHRLVGVVIVGKDVDVDVRRFHDAQVGLIGRGAGGERMERDQGRSCA